MTGIAEPFYLECVRAEFRRKRGTNDQYSLRAFARALKIDHGMVAAIFAGRRIPSKAISEKLIAALSLDSNQTQLFLRSIDEERRRRSFTKINQKFEKETKSPQVESQSISAEDFGEISRWYYAAIMELTFVEGFNSDPEWVADRIGITTDEATSAIQRLLDLGLLEKDGERIIKTDRVLNTRDRHRTTDLLREGQKEVLEKAIEALEIVPIQARSQTTVTLAIDREKIPEAKRMIEEFNRTLTGFLESGKQDSVYELSIALFPLDWRESDEN